ncbi:MAG: hypothetical protein RJQ00_02790 [Vicingaceae bacterium]
MKTLTKQLFLLIILATNLIANSIVAQNASPLLLEFNELSILDPLVDDNDLIEKAFQKSYELSSIRPISNQFEVQSEELVDVHSNLNEVDLFLLLNEMESVDIELWSDNELLIEKECNFGDEFLSECLKYNEEQYTIVLKAKGKVTIFNE